MKAIEKKIKTVEERIHRLEDIATKLVSYSQYERSPDLKDIAERNIQVAIEACLDIGKIVISQERLNEPKDNKGIFTVLAEAQIISEKTLGFMVPIAGTRNILVHGYDRIDDSLVYGILKRHLGDFQVFLREVRDGYLKKNPPETA